MHPFSLTIKKIIKYIYLNKTSLISLIFVPLFPINNPHCVAGTINRIVIGGFETQFGNA